MLKICINVSHICMYVSKNTLHVVHAIDDSLVQSVVVKRIENGRSQKNGTELNETERNVSQLK